LLSKDDLVRLVCREVDSNGNVGEFEDIISEIIFDKGGNIILFSHQVLPYLNLRSPNAKLKNLQNYICKLFIDDEVLSLINTIHTNSAETNILYKLILEQLKNTDQKEADIVSDEGYYQGALVETVRNLFKEDLKNLVLN